MVKLVSCNLGASDDEMRSLEVQRESDKENDGSVSGGRVSFLCSQV